MNRREFLGAGAGLAAGVALSGLGRAADQPDKPNIIIILTDDLGYGDLRCYGSEAIATPNIDRLAQNGVRLTSFFSSGPVCSPSRAGLLTGRYPIRTGVTDVFQPVCNPAGAAINAVSGLPLGMNIKEITLGQALKELGYATCCIGKWHLGDLKKFRPHHRGFDHYFGLLYSNDMVPLPLYRNDEIVEKSPVNQDYLTQKYTGEALQFIEQNRERPFFLYLPHTFPHQPLHASPDFRNRSAGGLYGDAVEEIDWSTGEILKAIEKFGITERTLLFFTSDNGPWYQGSTGGFRGRKNETYDGGMHVPLLACWPRVIPAGRVSDELSMNFDLFATAVAVAGGRVPGDRPIDGLNILPMLKGDDASPHEELFYYKGHRLQAVRQGQWKYHRRHPVSVYPYFNGHGPWLFNLDNDPDESYDVSDKYPDIAEKMEKLMKEWESSLVKGVK